MPASYDRCVKKVKAKGKVSNPYAVCRASMGTDEQIRARQRRKGHKLDRRLKDTHRYT